MNRLKVWRCFNDRFYFMTRQCPRRIVPFNPHPSPPFPTELQEKLNYKSFSIFFGLYFLFKFPVVVVQAQSVSKPPTCLNEIGDVGGHLINTGVVEFFYIVQNPLVFDGDKVDGDAFPAESAASSNSEIYTIFYSYIEIDNFLTNTYQAKFSRKIVGALRYLKISNISATQWQI